MLEDITRLKASWATCTPKLLEDADLEELAGARSCAFLLPEQVRGPWVKGLLWISIQVSEMSKKSIKVSSAQRAQVGHPCGISKESLGHMSRPGVLCHSGLSASDSSTSDTVAQCGHVEYKVITSSHMPLLIMRKMRNCTAECLMHQLPVHCLRSGLYSGPGVQGVRPARHHGVAG